MNKPSYKKIHAEYIERFSELSADQQAERLDAMNEAYEAMNNLFKLLGK